MGLSGSKLYRLSGGTVIPASEALYPAEADLQQLIAENPQLLLQMGQPFSPLTISSLTKTVFPCSSR